MTNILVINCGSSSLKFAIINADSGATALSGVAEPLVRGDARISFQISGEDTRHRALGTDAGHSDAMSAVVDIIHSQGMTDTLVAVGHRIVHGGELFFESVLITDAVIEAVRNLSLLAPLHNPANIIGAEAARAAFPHLPQVAVFDTAFHQTMPEHAYLYALPHQLYQEHAIRRYGMHGTSHFYVSRRAAQLLERPIDETNLICAHLGNGASVTAIRGGQSVDTSMGMTPVEGLIMGTRCGDIDPSLTHFLAGHLGMSLEQVNDMYNNDSGLLGISGISNDCRQLEAAASGGNERATLALEMFCYRLAKYIAGYMVAVERLDALVLTGGIGENSAFIRSRLLALLAPMGFELDAEANLATRFGKQGVISTATSKKAIVIPTNEEWVIAQDAASVVKASHGNSSHNP